MLRITSKRYSTKLVNVLRAMVINKSRPIAK